MGHCRFLRLRFRCLLAAAPILLLSGACVPFVADQQSARLLEPGHVEVTPSFSSVSFSAEGETEHVQNQFGLRFGYGASPNVEVRGLYERVRLDEDVRLDDTDVNLLGAGVKVGLVRDQLALFLPVGVAFGGDVDSGETWTFVPTLLATWRAAPALEFNPSIKALYPFAIEDPELFLGFHLGAGISTDMDRWAFRPEVGAVINPGDEGTTWGWAVGFSFRP